MAHARDDLVRIVVILPPEERDAFDKFVRYGGPKLSMTAAVRELCRAAVAGDITLDRKRAKKLSRTAPEPPPKPSRPRHTALPQPDAKRKR